MKIDTDTLMKRIKLVTLLGLYALIIMLLWNTIVPNVFTLTTITYWQALGLRLLVNTFLAEVEITS